MNDGMTVAEIIEHTDNIESWLTEHSYDGLCCPALECGCSIKNGLFLCDTPLDENECVSAWLVDYEKCTPENCYYGMYGECRQDCMTVDEDRR